MRKSVSETNNPDTLAGNYKLAHLSLIIVMTTICAELFSIKHVKSSRGCFCLRDGLRDDFDYHNNRRLDDIYFELSDSLVPNRTVQNVLLSKCSCAHVNGRRMYFVCARVGSVWGVPWKVLRNLFSLPTDRLEQLVKLTNISRSCLFPTSIDGEIVVPIELVPDVLNEFGDFDVGMSPCFSFFKGWIGNINPFNNVFLFARNAVFQFKADAIGTPEHLPFFENESLEQQNQSLSRELNDLRNTLKSRGPGGEGSMTHLSKKRGGEAPEEHDRPSKQQKYLSGKRIQ